MRRNAWLGVVGVALLVALLTGGARSRRRRGTSTPAPTPAAAPPFAEPRAAPGPRPESSPTPAAPDDAAAIVGLALVRGRVVTFDGRPAGGEVGWRPGDESPLTDGVAGGVALDASGRFEVQVPAAPIVLVAITDDDDVAAERLTLADGEQREVVLTVRQPDTSPIAVHLAGPAGEPIAGAEIQADPEPGADDALRAWFLFRRWGRTGADGVARLVLPAGRYRFWHRPVPGDGLSDPAADARLPPSARATADVDRDHGAVSLVERELPIVHCTLFDAGGARVRPRVRQVTRLDASPAPPAPDDDGGDGDGDDDRDRDGDGDGDGGDDGDGDGGDDGDGDGDGDDDDGDIVMHVPRIARSITGPPADVLHLAWTAPMVVTLGTADQRADVTLATPRDRCDVHVPDE